MDALDLEVFTCCKCGKDFNHTEGTWLPIGEEDKALPLSEGEFPTILYWSDWLKPPELVTSDKFTCYNCI